MIFFLIISLSLIIFRAVGLTVAQILSLLEDESPAQATDIVILPPDQGQVVSDEDSDDEDGGPKDPNHVGRQLMNQQAEMETHHACDFVDEMDPSLDDAVLDNNQAVPGPSSSNATRQIPKRMVLKPSNSGNSRQAVEVVEDPGEGTSGDPPLSTPTTGAGKMF